MSQKIRKYKVYYVDEWDETIFADNIQEAAEYAANQSVSAVASITLIESIKNAGRDK